MCADSPSGMEEEFKERDRHVAELEALLEQKDEQIALLEEALAAGSHAQEEVQQLQALVEAQESALNDQREIMESQSTLVDELNRQLQSQISGHQREAELEELVGKQRERIAQLEAAGRGVAANSAVDASREEIEQLQAIVEAQESALNDQRLVMASQSTLIDELNVRVQAQMMSQQYELITPRLALDEIPEYTPSCGPVGGGDRPIALGGGAAGGSCGSLSARVSHRRRPAEGASPLAVAMRPSGHSGGLGRRSHREQHFAQQKALSSAAGQALGSVAGQLREQTQTSRAELPRPRPNSVLGSRSAPAATGGASAGGASTPRARSSTAERGYRTSSPSGRGPSPHAALRQHPGMPRRAGGPVPPSLPLLRQEA